MKYLEELKNLGLPADQFAVFGSGSLAIRGLRENKDIDVIVKEHLWQRLADDFSAINSKEVVVGNISFFNNWLPWFDDVDALIDGADIIDGLRFVTLENVVSWKTDLAREKDLSDVALIKKYLNSK